MCPMLPANTWPATLGIAWWQLRSCCTLVNIGCHSDLLLRLQELLPLRQDPQTGDWVLPCSLQVQRHA